MADCDLCRYKIMASYILTRNEATVNYVISLTVGYISQIVLWEFLKYIWCTCDVRLFIIVSLPTIHQFQNLK